MKLDAIDVEGFAGGFTCGVVQAGFRLVGKRELPGGFGVASCEANRHILGDKWQTEVCPAPDWSPMAVPLVFGNPPCSGFSLLSRADFRGGDSPINACMHSFVEYAARCRPDIAVFESVQQAYKIGRPLMQELRAKMETLTGDRYGLFHVLHNAASVGGCAVRRRYFFLISKIPFGIEPPTVTRMPTLMGAIGDLQQLAITWERQPYRLPPSWWSKPLRARTGVVDGHINRLNPLARRTYDLMKGIDWPEGANISDVARRYYERYGTLPESWEPNIQKLIGNDFRMGFYQMHRWKGQDHARVVTGAAVQLVLHPREDRLLTNREVARIQGFPDDWKILPLRGQSGVDQLWGKGIPTQCGKWIAGWAKEAINGNPGSVTGTPMPDGEREYVIDCTNDYRSAIMV